MHDSEDRQTRSLRIEFLAPPSAGRGVVTSSWPRVLVGDDGDWTVLDLKPNARELAVLLALAPQGLLARDIGRALAARPRGVVPHDGGRSARDGARRNLQAALESAGAAALLNLPKTRGRTSATYSLAVRSTDLDELHQAVSAADLPTATRLSYEGEGWLRGLSVSGGLDEVPPLRRWTASPGRLSASDHEPPLSTGLLPHDLLERTLNDARWVRTRLARDAVTPEGPLEGPKLADSSDASVPSRSVPDQHGARTTDIDGGATPAERSAPQHRGRRRERRQKVRMAAVASVMGAVVVAVSIGVFTAGDDEAPGASSSVAAAVTARAAELQPAYRVYAGGPARTWADFTIAGGRPGPQVVTRSAVDVTCRADGFVVPDGNRWWYLVASPPWRKRYWVTADAFYNRPGVDSGTLKGTPFFDARVPVCP